MSSADPLDIVILAAGKGTRMNSQRPKVLHELGGRSMLGHVVDAATALSPAGIHIVVGAGRELIESAFAAEPVAFVLQKEQLGTGHAVAQALPVLGEDSLTLVLYGDVPLLQSESLEKLLSCMPAHGMALMTAVLDNPAALGRIVRNEQGTVERIVEFKDASEAERGICEINTGIMLVRSADLARWLPKLATGNAQGEYYLTDIVAMARAEGLDVAVSHPVDVDEVRGINDRVQLAENERILQRRRSEALMRSGTTLNDPARVDIRGTVTAGQDCVVDVNVVFEGTVQLGSGVSIGANCVIRDARIADGATIHANSIVDDSSIGERASIGPFARIRPGTQLAEDVKIGNFVETKKARLGAGSKASHLAYLGDAEIGAGCNIGAGTITCNYDGFDKFVTTMGDGVFVGSNSTLVAPLQLESGAYIGAGSTVTKTVPADSLAVGRGKQKNIEGWVHPAKRDKS